MGAFLKLLWTDSDYFRRCLRGVIFGLGTMLTTGVVTLDSINATFGQMGWWVGLVLTICAFIVRVGDTTPPAAAALSLADPHLMKRQLVALGVPVKEASEATTPPPPPQVNAGKD